MNVQRLITDLSVKGVRFELDGEGFRVRAPHGLITPEVRDELSAYKPEIVDLLKLMDAEVAVSYIAGNCPHCQQLLKVFTHPLDDEVWIQCPTKPELFKAFRHDAREWCQDCTDKLTVIAGRCSECIQRLMLAPDEACQECSSLSFWRYRATSERVAGFAWHCANCEEPTGKVAVYELNLEPREGN
jgi:hypothetical protein